VTRVAMESTSVYWPPAFRILEGRFQLPSSFIFVGAATEALPGASDVQRYSRSGYAIGGTEVPDLL
jgi:hypothetical protein